MPSDIACTFCHRPQRDARKLINSPDHLTYICDACAIDPERLGAEASEPKKPSLRDLFAKSVMSSTPCSFCLERNERSYISATDPEVSARICESCVVVCRKILAEELK